MICWKLFIFLQFWGVKRSVLISFLGSMPVKFAKAFFFWFRAFISSIPILNFPFDNTNKELLLKMFNRNPIFWYLESFPTKLFSVKVFNNPKDRKGHGNKFHTYQKISKAFQDCQIPQKTKFPYFGGKLLFDFFQMTQMIGHSLKTSVRYIE